MGKTRDVFRAAVLALSALYAVALAACAPRMVENQPLARPVGLVSIEPPGVVHLSDGRQYRLAAVHVLSKVDGEALKPLTRGETLVEPVTPLGPIARFRLRQILWRCGVGEAFTLFPKPQNLYTAGDLGLALVGLGRAIPMSAVFSVDPQYAHTMVLTMAGSGLMSTVEVPADDEDAAKARRLIVEQYGSQKIEYCLWKTVSTTRPSGPPAK